MLPGRFGGFVRTGFFLPRSIYDARLATLAPSVRVPRTNTPSSRSTHPPIGKWIHYPQFHWQGGQKDIDVPLSTTATSKRAGVVDKIQECDRRLGSRIQPNVPMEPSAKLIQPMEK
ncbi:cytochrome C-binding protein [Anopheles sinensis]|uniref:Cytochrome C-binding protein n=1 Tax=Anopheles sinensis TaxID=74873 RepID=A0A084VU39_ANOSI|nr:cytochrome C-binding protein [Anopheles sinensis]